MSDLENDTPKYRKKKDSSTSKSKVKSKHKHEYVDCLIITKERKCPHKSTYCKICGKIGDIHFFETEPIGNGLYRQLDVDEVYEKYNDLENIFVDDILQKYVPVSKGDIKDE